MAPGYPLFPIVKTLIQLHWRSIKFLIGVYHFFIRVDLAKHHMQLWGSGNTQFFTFPSRIRSFIKLDVLFGFLIEGAFYYSNRYLF